MLNELLRGHVGAMAGTNDLHLGWTELVGDPRDGLPVWPRPSSRDPRKIGPGSASPKDKVCGYPRLDA